jgi:hypothetical protein
VGLAVVYVATVGTDVQRRAATLLKTALTKLTERAGP